MVVHLVDSTGGQITDSNMLVFDVSVLCFRTPEILPFSEFNNGIISLYGQQNMLMLITDTDISVWMQQNFKGGRL